MRLYLLVNNKFMSMKTLTFQVHINAPVIQVYDHMLGLKDKATYERWTALFDPNSTYEGNWKKGSRIYFVSKDQEGLNQGMVAIVSENIPHEFVSLSHIGHLEGGREILTADADPSIGEMLESYTFVEKDGVTSIDIRVDCEDKYEDYFRESWVLALQKLKQDCEK